MSMKKYEEWNANHKHDNPPREKIVTALPPSGCWVTKE